MVYNITGIAANGTDLLTLTQGINTTLTMGWLFTMILIGLSIIIFTSFFYSTREIGGSILATAFITFVLAVLLRAVNLVPNSTLFITLIFAAGAIGFTYKR